MPFGEVVDDHNIVPASGELLRRVGANVAGSTGNHYAHVHFSSSVPAELELGTTRLAGDRGDKRPGSPDVDIKIACLTVFDIQSAGLAIRPVFGLNSETRGPRINS